MPLRPLSKSVVKTIYGPKDSLLVRSPAVCSAGLGRPSRIPLPAEARRSPRKTESALHGCVRRRKLEWDPGSRPRKRPEKPPPAYGSRCGRRPTTSLMYLYSKWLTARVGDATFGRALRSKIHDSCHRLTVHGSVNAALGTVKNNDPIIIIRA